MAFHQLGQRLRPVRPAVIVAVVLLVLAALVALVQPLATQSVLASLGADTSLRTPVTFLVVAVLGSAAAQGAGQFLMLRVAEDVVAGARVSLVDRVLGISMAAANRRDPGELISRVVSDTASVRQIALQSVVQSVTGLITVTGSIALMLWLDWLLFLVTFAVVAGLCLVLVLVMPRIRSAAHRTQQSVAELNSDLERALGSFSTVKAAVAEPVESRRIGRRIRTARHAGVRGAWWSALAALSSALTVQAAFLVVLAVGALRVQSGVLTVATLVAFLLYAMQLSGPVMQLTAAVSAFQAGRAALERMAETETLEQEAGADGDDDDATRTPSWAPAAELRGVVFGYPGEEEPILRGVDLTVPARGLTALVGPSGSGKSTVLRLLEGFYPPDEGEVVVGGRDVASWDLAELRQNLGYVEQETPVLAGTIEDNLVYGLPETPPAAEVEQALDRAGLTERVTDVGEEVAFRGNSLSGGERQRINIARALLRHPRLLLLDEVTSQLDAHTEAAMRSLVEEISAQVPVVVVAHRLSTIVHADQIVVLVEGRVHAVGTHDHLVATDADYRAMLTEQGLLGGASRAVHPTA